MSAQRYKAFEDWQQERGIPPWTAIHPQPRGHVETAICCQATFELARANEQAKKFEALWAEEYARASRYRAQLERVHLVPFDADPYPSPGIPVVA